MLLSAYRFSNTDKSLHHLPSHHLFFLVSPLIVAVGLRNHYDVKKLVQGSLQIFDFSRLDSLLKMFFFADGFQIFQEEYALFLLLFTEITSFKVFFRNSSCYLNLLLKFQRILRRTFRLNQIFHYYFCHPFIQSFSVS